MGAAASTRADINLSPEYNKKELELMVVKAAEKIESLESQLRFSHEAIRDLANCLGREQVRSELEDLRQLFSKWKAADSEEKKAHTVRRIHGRFVKRKVLLCSDMSGFSRICKEEGILHFLSLVKMMQSIMLPICEKRGGHLCQGCGR